MAAGKAISIAILAGIILGVSLSPAHAEEVKYPTIVNMRLYNQNGHLTGDITCKGLFSSRITGTIRSGLPAVVELFYHLVESRKGTAKKGVFSWSLRHDVWDGSYSVTSNDSTIDLPTLKSMRGMIENLRGIPIIPIHLMVPRRTYRVQMSIAINPLQGTDKERIEGWIDEKVRSDDEGSWREQVLNINNLISWCFSKEKQPANRSKWFFSKPFTLSTLKRSEAGRSEAPPANINSLIEKKDRRAQAYKRLSNDRVEEK